MLLDDLAETWGPEATPATESSPATDLQRAWADDGVVIVKGLLPEALMELYEKEWLAENGGAGHYAKKPKTYRSPGGWRYATPYMTHPALRDLVCCRELSELLHELIGEAMGVHLNLTGWQSTRRDWHFDQYLNEPYVGGFYAAVWMALDTIHPDSGPFQYVPGSHRTWSPLSQRKVRTELNRIEHGAGDGPDWPTRSEMLLSPIFEAELARLGVAPTSYLPRRGDVLVWHSRLLHRGSKPRDETLERRALIAHYSGVFHRPDFPTAQPHGAGWLFPIDGRQPTS